MLGMGTQALIAPSIAGDAAWPGFLRKFGHHLCGSATGNPAHRGGGHARRMHAAQAPHDPGEINLKHDRRYD